MTTNELVLQIVHELAWPIAVVVIALMFRHEWVKSRGKDQ